MLDAGAGRRRTGRLAGRRAGAAAGLRRADGRRGASERAAVRAAVGGRGRSAAAVRRRRLRRRVVPRRPVHDVGQGRRAGRAAPGAARPAAGSACWSSSPTGRCHRPCPRATSSRRRRSCANCWPMPASASRRPRRPTSPTARRSGPSAPTRSRPRSSAGTATDPAFQQAQEQSGRVGRLLSRGAPALARRRHRRLSSRRDRRSRTLYVVKACEIGDLAGKGCSKRARHLAELGSTPWRISSTAIPSGRSGTRCSPSPAIPRRAYSGLYAAVQPIDGEELAARADLLSQTYRDAGVTFAHAGEEQPFPLDIVPRVIGADEWDVIERGVAQRVLRAGGVPRRRLRRRAGASPTGSCRAASSPPARTSTARRTGWCRPTASACTSRGIDLVRDEAGDFRVLEDNLRSPSGVSYVITNRAAMSQVLPELFADHRIQPVADYPTQAAGRAEGVRAVERGRPDGRRPHARRLQLRLLRARAARPADGRRAGRGPRPDLRGQPGEHADDGRPAARRRHLPPHRRRVPRPGALPARLGDRLRRRAERRAGRPGDHRQRRRQRRRRRQADLHLGARPDPLLPGRGAGAAERRHLPAGRRRHRRVGARVARPAGAQAGRRLRRQGHRHRAAGRRADAGGAGGQGAGRRRATGSRRSRSGCPPARRWWAAGSPRGTSTCARSRSTTAQGVGAARRPDPGGAAGGRAGGQLQPGRRLEGHLGDQPAAPGRGGRGARPHAHRVHRRRPARRPARPGPGPAQRRRRSASSSSSNSSRGGLPC